MTNSTLLLLVLGLLLIAGLAVYALLLWRRVWQAERQREAQRIDRRQALADDLRILASSLLDEQLPLIEGAIRIKVLIDNYDTALTRDPRCEVFHTLYQATEHVPTHAAWKALDKPARRQFEATFSALELQHKAEARRAARWLLDEGLAQPRNA